MYYSENVIVMALSNLLFTFYSIIHFSVMVPMFKCGQHEILVEKKIIMYKYWHYKTLLYNLKLVYSHTFASHGLGNLLCWCNIEVVVLRKAGLFLCSCISSQKLLLF